MLIRRLDRILRFSLSMMVSASSDNANGLEHSKRDKFHDTEANGVIPDRNLKLLPPKRNKDAILTHHFNGQKYESKWDLVYQEFYSSSENWLRILYDSNILSKVQKKSILDSKLKRKDHSKIKLPYYPEDDNFAKLFNQYLISCDDPRISNRCIKLEEYNLLGFRTMLNLFHSQLKLMENIIQDEKTQVSTKSEHMNPNIDQYLNDMENLVVNIKLFSDIFKGLIKELSILFQKIVKQKHAIKNSKHVVCMHSFDKSEFTRKFRGYKKTIMETRIRIFKKLGLGSSNKSMSRLKLSKDMVSASGKIFGCLKAIESYLEFLMCVLEPNTPSSIKRLNRAVYKVIVSSILVSAYEYLEDAKFDMHIIGEEIMTFYSRILEEILSRNMPKLDKTKEFYKKLVADKFINIESKETDLGKMDIIMLRKCVKEVKFFKNYMVEKCEKCITHKQYEEIAGKVSREIIKVELLFSPEIARVNLQQEIKSRGKLTNSITKAMKQPFHVNTSEYLPSISEERESEKQDYPESIIVIQKSLNTPQNSEKKDVEKATEYIDVHSKKSSEVIQILLPTEQSASFANLGDDSSEENSNSDDDTDQHSLSRTDSGYHSVPSESI